MLIYNLDTRCLNFVTTWSSRWDNNFTINWFQILVKVFISCIRFARQFTLFFPFRNIVDLALNYKRSLWYSYYNIFNCI